MAEFIELTQQSVGKVLVSVEHIVKIKSLNNGSMIYLDVPGGYGNSISIQSIHVEESYAELKRKLCL